ncbi:MAG TPA: hypothetical protein VKB57_23380, partial [Acidimicrobiales bacterium]|nr:hypothetical protein [Acidimicrobiales bacterium]
HQCPAPAGSLDDNLVQIWFGWGSTATAAGCCAPPAPGRAEESEREARSLVRTVGYPLTFRWLDPA